MKKLNFLTLSQDGNIYLNGFDMVDDFIYVKDYENKGYLLFITHERWESDTCFKVTVDENRVVKNDRLMQLVMEYDLLNKRFLEDENLKNYLSSKIEV